VLIVLTLLGSRAEKLIAHAFSYVW
jgi:hypothetical protein